MPLHLERINWMPSPPLAPDDGPIDVEHLRRMTLGDIVVVQGAGAVGLSAAALARKAGAHSLLVRVSAARS